MSNARGGTKRRKKGEGEDISVEITLISSGNEESENQGLDDGKVQRMMAGDISIFCEDLSEMWAKAFENSKKAKVPFHIKNESLPIPTFSVVSEDAKDSSPRRQGTSHEEDHTQFSAYSENTPYFSEDAGTDMVSDAVIPAEMIKFDENIKRANEELRVDYDADGEDEMFLKSLNQELRTGVSLIDFEWAIEQLEKKTEDYEENYDTDSRPFCCICGLNHANIANRIVFCNGCGISVHQYCYGIPKFPKGSWFCRACEVNTRPICCICKQKDGAFKRTTDNRWCHVVCALFNEETFFQQPQFMEPIAGVESIPVDKWQKRCCICL